MMSSGPSARLNIYRAQKKRRARARRFSTLKELKVGSVLLGHRLLEHAIDLLVGRINTSLRGLGSRERLVGSALSSGGSLGSSLRVGLGLRSGIRIGLVRNVRGQTR